jgi:hypothetical protein
MGKEYIMAERGHTFHGRQKAEKKEGTGDQVYITFKGIPSTLQRPASSREVLPPKVPTTS